jgi:hypothetical protein
MKTLDYKQIFKEELKQWIKDNKKIDGSTMPIIYKMSLNRTNEELEEDLGAIDNNLDKDEIIRVIKDKFNIKEVLKFKITKNNKVYSQNNFGDSGAIKWIKNFIEEEKISYKIFSQIKNSSDVITFSKNRQDMSDKTNPTQLNVLGDIFYFNHKHWGLDKMNKDKNQISNRKNEGDGVLFDKINELSKYLSEEIKIEVEGVLVIRSLGKYEEKIFMYENNNS